MGKGFKTKKQNKQTNKKHPIAERAAEPEMGSSGAGRRRYRREGQPAVSLGGTANGRRRWAPSSPPGRVIIS